jgi:hypothetical protein
VKATTVARRLHWRASWIALGFAAVFAAGCTQAIGSAAPSSGDSGAAASVATSVTSSPSPAATSSVEPSVAASAPASSGGTSAGEARRYECPALISEAEIRQASGVADLALVGGPSDNAPDGLTDCGYFGASGALYVQVTIWTGESKVEFDQAWDQATAGAESLPGIGDAAAYGRGGEQAQGGAKVGPVGITVVFQQMSAGGLDGIDLKAAVSSILGTVAGRV